MINCQAIALQWNNVTPHWRHFTNTIVCMRIFGILFFVTLCRWWFCVLYVFFFIWCIVSSAIGGVNWYRWQWFGIQRYLGFFFTIGSSNVYYCIIGSSRLIVSLLLSSAMFIFFIFGGKSSSFSLFLFMIWIHYEFVVVVIQLMLNLLHIFDIITTNVYSDNMSQTNVPHINCEEY